MSYFTYFLLMDNRYECVLQCTNREHINISVLLFELLDLVLHKTP